MNKFIIILTTILTLTTSASAMSYNQAREQALFLTDKMAYELNLNEEQYDAAYEVNLDYLMSIDTYDDLYGTYWTQRNLDLSYILLDWQYRAFCAASYFYRPLYWTAGVWHFAIYARYPRRNFFYFSRPTVYITYRGGHSWRYNGGRSWYKGRTFNHGSIGRGYGMRDRFDRGDFKRGHKGTFDRPGNYDRRPNSRLEGNRFNRNFGKKSDAVVNLQNNKGNNNNRGFNGQRNFRRNNRESSTRTTARPGLNNNRGFRLEKSERKLKTPNNTFSPKRSSSGFSVNRSTPTRSFNKSGGGGSRKVAGGSRGGNFGGRR